MTTKTTAAKTAKAVKTAKANVAEIPYAKALKAAATEAELAMVVLPVPDMSRAVAETAGPQEAAAPAVDGLAVETDAVSGEDESVPRHVVIEAATGAAAAKLAVKRFNAAADAADTITLTVPLSFRKMSVQNQLDPSFHLVEDSDRLARIAGADGRVRSLPCAVQTWERRPEPRTRHALATRHADFAFCARSEADVAIQRVGTAAGRLKAPDNAGSVQSHLFLRAVGCSPAELWVRLAAIDFDTVRHNTAAVPSVAKTEIVALYEATRGIAAAATVPGKRPSAPVVGGAPAVSHHESAVEGATTTGAAAPDGSVSKPIACQP